MRFAFAALLLVHAAIHLIGVARAWKPGHVAQPSGRALDLASTRAQRGAGLLWLLASVLLAAAAISYLARGNAWVALAIGGVCLSQALVISKWSEAKAGTLVNVVLALLVLSTMAERRFYRQIEDEVRTLFRTTASASDIVEPQRFEGSPAPDPGEGSCPI